jgi:enoyl-CoA hydratase/carnithine racemase
MLTMAYTDAALSSERGVTWSLPRIVGVAPAPRDPRICNLRLTAEHAVTGGIVNRVVDPDKLEDTTTAWARADRCRRDFAYGAVKAVLRQSSISSLDDQLATEADFDRRARRNDRPRRGRNASRGKRRPTFGGTPTPPAEASPANHATESR